jgi:hypothetical protein
MRCRIYAADDSSFVMEMDAGSEGTAKRNPSNEETCTFRKNHLNSRR